jgi:hypothetical protein
MNENLEKRISSKIEQFLKSRSQYWYPQKIIIYKKKLSYSAFDNMLKREILYTGYVALERIVKIEIQTSHKNYKLDILFIYEDTENSLKLPDLSIIDVLKREGITRNIKYYDFKDGQTGSFYNFQSKFYYDDKTYTAIGYIKNKKLLKLSIYKYDVIATDRFTDSVNKGVDRIFYDEMKLRELMILIINYWLQEIQPIIFEWSSQNISVFQNSIFNLEVYQQLTDITVDSSTEEEPIFFRWNVDSFSSQCKSCSILKKQEVEHIMVKSGLKIPEDAELIGISPDGASTVKPSLMVIYIHTITDPEYEFDQNESPRYQNKGKIVIEGDLCVLHIDPLNKKVISECRKWHNPNMKYA